MPKIQEFLQGNAARKSLDGTGKVCTSLPPPQRAPWLVFFSHGKQQRLHTFVSLPEEKVYVRELEEMRRSYCYACCRGWLFMTDLSHRQCFLLDLPSRKKIMLPPPPRGIDSISDVLITSPPPPRGKGSAAGGSNACMILCYWSDGNAFLYHILGQDMWGMAKCRSERGIHSLVECNGTIYALAQSTELVAVDVEPHPRVRTLLDDRRSLLPTNLVFNRQLLESQGELFQVCMFHEMFTRRFHSFEVYRLDQSDVKWVEVSNLGADRAFFFGACCDGYRDTGLSCSSSRAGIATNCIYFVDPKRSSSTILKYDMADKSVSTAMSWPTVPKPWADVAWINILDS